MNLIVSVSPHIKSEETVRKIMLDVIIALIPAGIFGVWFFGYRAFFLILTCVGTCVITEFIVQKIMKRRPAVDDLSAALTGLLLAYCLSPATPLWIAGIGSVFSIIFGKQIFGGLGHNPFNPALIGRAFLQISWPKDTSVWITPFDSVTTATPLSILKYFNKGDVPDYWTLFFGDIGGCLGETSKIMLIAGALYLLNKKQIKLYTPLSYILSVIVMVFLFRGDPVFHLLTGGIILGAFFMATDPVTTPLTDKGKIIFGAGCGILTVLIRLKGGYPEGVCYSILIMNMLTPFIDKITVRKRFGV